jgi:hypothetical protein
MNIYVFFRILISWHHIAISLLSNSLEVLSVLLQLMIYVCPLYMVQSKSYLNT